MFVCLTIIIKNVAQTDDLEPGVGRVSQLVRRCVQIIWETIFHHVTISIKLGLQQVHEDILMQQIWDK